MSELFNSSTESLMMFGMETLSQAIQYAIQEDM